MKQLILGTMLGVSLARWIGEAQQQRRGRGAPRVPDKGGLLTDVVRTGPVARIMFRALAWLYDMGLGRLAGHRFLRLTHRGRRSGHVYRTVLEVIDYEPRNRESIVLSGWGGRADWYRNIQANSALEVATADQRYVPIQRFPGSSELYARLLEYVDRNRPMRGMVRRVLGLRLDGSDADRSEFSRHGYLGVAFRPAT